ncbi:hypothetical protein HDE_04978 [Halotydeus destructor]|nr:hypothetical protein HDE_04978 [Halotydeus destructor]
MAQNYDPYQVTLNVPPATYPCPQFTDRLGHRYDEQNIPMEGCQVTVTVRPKDEYRPTLLRAAGRAMQASPPPGAPYGACPTVIPGRILRYFQPALAGQAIPEEFRETLLTVVPLEPDHPARLQFVRWEMHPFITPDPNTTEGYLVPNRPGTINVRDTNDPNILPYGYRVAEGGQLKGQLG